jgi:hypothetical protein
LKKIPGIWQAFMAFGTVCALLAVAWVVESPTVGHVVAAAGWVGLAILFDVIIWRTFTRKRD